MPVKAVFFDLVGTCLYWHSTIANALPACIPHDIRDDFALEWHSAIFETYSKLAKDGITDPLMLSTDTVYRQTLEELLLDYEEMNNIFDAHPDLYDIMISTWHELAAWFDVQPELQHLRDLGLQLYVSANGSARRHVDQTRFAMLKFDMLFSSEVIGAAKPGMEAERIAMDRLGLKPDEVVMVASHVDSLRGAKELGMRTVYVHRWEDDIGQDQRAREDHHVYLEGMTGLSAHVQGWMVCDVPWTFE